MPKNMQIYLTNTKFQFLKQNLLNCNKKINNKWITVKEHELHQTNILKPGILISHSPYLSDSLLYLDSFTAKCMFKYRLRFSTIYYAREWMHLTNIYCDNTKYCDFYICKEDDYEKLVDTNSYEPAAR